MDITSATHDEGALSAPQGAPQFVLTDDADGRFVVDDATGVVSLSSESVLERDRGDIYPARLRVYERDGSFYELALRLRITGLVPQSAATDDFFGAPLEQDLDIAAGPIEAPAAPQPRPAPVFSPSRWLNFAAWRADHTPLVTDRAPFAGALFGAAITIAVGDGLELDSVDLAPQPAPAQTTHDETWEELAL